MAKQIDLRLSIRPTAALDEINGSGYFWVIIDALVPKADLNEYLERSKVASDLSVEFVEDALDMVAVPFPDDIEIELKLEFPTLAPVTRTMPRRTAYRFVDRAAFLAANRSESWTQDGIVDDGLDWLDPSINRSPAFRNEALRQVLARPEQTDESADYKTFLLQSSAFGAARFVDPSTFDLTGLADNVMLFDDGLGHNVMRTNQYSLDGQLARFPLYDEDPVTATVRLTGLTFDISITKALTSALVAKRASLSKFLSSPSSAPEVTVSIDANVTRRLYAHGRWEQGTCQVLQDARLGGAFFFANVPPNSNAPCAPLNGRSLLRVVAPDDGAEWGLDKNSGFTFSVYRSLNGMLKPYRGASKARQTDNKLWVFEPDQGEPDIIGRLLTDVSLQYVVSRDDPGLVLMAANQVTPLNMVGVYDFPWEGTIDHHKPIVIFWSRGAEVAPGNVSLILSSGFSGGYLERRPKPLTKKRRYWQAENDDAGSWSEEANCIFLLDAYGNPPARLQELSVEALRINAVDFELANSAQRFESRIESLAYAPRFSGVNAHVDAGRARPGFGAFNTYSPTFSWNGTTLPIVPFAVVEHAQTNPIATDWPADLKTSTYHVSLRQKAWEAPPAGHLGETIDGLYSTLGQSFYAVHVFGNPLGQSITADEVSGQTLFASSHFASVPKPTDIRFVDTGGTDQQFLTIEFAEDTQEIVVTANLDVLSDGASPSGRVAAWMAYKCIAEFAYASDITLSTEFLVFDNRDVLSADPASASPSQCLVRLPSDLFEPLVSLNGAKQVFKNWLAGNPPAGRTEVGRYPVKLKGSSANLNDVAHAMRFSLLITRPPASLPSFGGYNYTFLGTFRPGFDILKSDVPALQANDGALMCAADQWLGSIAFGSSYVSPPSDTLLSLTALASTQNDPAPEFLGPFKSPPNPAVGEVKAAMVPVGVRPIASLSQVDLLTGRAVSRLFQLLAMTIDCSVPEWWQRWDLTDWQVFFANMPTRNGQVELAFDYIMDALIALIAAVPSSENQPDKSYIPELVAAVDGEIQNSSSRLRQRLKAELWPSMSGSDRACFGMLSLISSDSESADLPTDLWRMTFAFGTQDAVETGETQTLDVTDVSKRIVLGRPSLTAIALLNRTQYRELATIDYLDVLRGAAAINKQASGLGASIPVPSINLPGASDDLAPGAKRIPVRLPALSQFVPPQFVSVARRTVPDGASGLFPLVGKQVSRRGLEQSNVIDPTMASGDGCLVLATGNTGSRSMRYDTSIRVCTFKIRGSGGAGPQDGLLDDLFEILVRRPDSSGPGPVFQGYEEQMLLALADETPLELLEQVAKLRPQDSPYQYYADTTLAQMVRPADPYVPMDDFRIASVRLERTSGGVVPRIQIGNPILWAEVGFSSATSSGSGDEFYLTVIAQMPVWHQQPLWLRQSRGAYDVARLGPRFVEHATAQITGVETVAYANVSYRDNSMLAGTPVPEVPRDFVPISLLNTLLSDVLEANGEWSTYEARMVLSHRMFPQLPTLDTNGINFADGVQLFDQNASYPLVSVYVPLWNWGNSARLPDGYSKQVLDAAWFSPGSSTPFFEVSGRNFTVA